MQATLASASPARPDLRQLLAGAEPVEPRHQRCVQACRFDWGPCATSVALEIVPINGDNDVDAVVVVISGKS